MHAFPTAPPGIFMDDGNKSIAHGYGVNPGSTLADGLESLWPIWEGAGCRSQDIAGSRNGEAQVVLDWQPGAGGPLILSDANNEDIVVIDPMWSPPYTWAIVQNGPFDGSAASFSLLSAAGTIQTFFKSNEFRAEFDGASDLIMRYTTAGNFWVPGVNTTIYTWTGENSELTVGFFTNGVAVPSSTDVSGIGSHPTAAIDRMHIGARASHVQGGVTRTYALIGWNRVLDANEIQEVSDNPFALFRPGTQQFAPAVVAAGRGKMIGPGGPMIGQGGGLIA